MADQSQSLAKSEVEITLGLLNAIERSDSVTQRSLAGELGIALGLANAYLKRSVKKGYIKVKHIPANRYAYYLTPKGFAEKTRLTAEYFSQSLKFFRIAREQCNALIAVCAQSGLRDVWLYGATDLGEIATLCGQNNVLPIRGFIDPNRGGGTFVGLPVIAELAGATPLDAVIITQTNDPTGAYLACVRALGVERVLVPDLLHVTQVRKLEDAAQ